MTANMNKIRLRVSNKKSYVWDVDDIALLRSQHHICGILTGTLPGLSQQNVFLGVPLLLTPEETVLLVDKELAVLVDDPSAHCDPSTSALRRWNEERTENFKYQISLAEEKEAREAVIHGRSMSEDAIRKRKAREEKRAREQAAVIMMAPDSVAVTNLYSPSEASTSKISDEPTAPSSAQPTVSAPEPSSSMPYTINVPASSSDLEWYEPEVHSFSSIAAAQEAGLWDYPTTLIERARCGVFRDLWEQGYFMGSGIKFGGDFLVYPGDPLRYHSHFVASVIESPDSAIRPMEIVAHGRLGTGTKKAHLLCGWDDTTGNVSYFSIEWAGFG